MTDMLLSEWAKRHKVRPRTATSWAQKKVIKAVKKKVKRNGRIVIGYVVDAKTKVPMAVKPKSRK